MTSAATPDSLLAVSVPVRVIERGTALVATGAVATATLGSSAGRSWALEDRIPHPARARAGRAMRARERVMVRFLRVPGRVASGAPTRALANSPLASVRGRDRARTGVRVRDRCTGA